MPNIKAAPLPPIEVLNECFHYDGDTGKLTWKVRPMHHFKTIGAFHSINTQCAGKEAGAVLTERGYSRRVVRLTVDGKDRLYYAHRIIWAMAHGSIDDALLIDHIDGNALDNRLCNLRLASKADNQRNQGIRFDNKTGYKGVHFDRSRGKFTVHIQRSGKSVFLGRYLKVEDAADAYQKAAEKLHGEFMCVNRMSSSNGQAFTCAKVTGS